MTHNLNSLKGVTHWDDAKENGSYYSTLGLYRVQGLRSILLKGGYSVGYFGDYNSGYDG